MNELQTPPTTSVLNHGFVRLIDSMGSDDRIVQSARVSYGEGTTTKRRDANLIDYLLRNEHTSPFEKVIFELHVKAPIFIARQWLRHRMSSTNEISARYSEMIDEFYMADEWRGQSTTNKQVSETNMISQEDQDYATEITHHIHGVTYTAYQDLLERGITREQARGILPVNLYTQFYWTIDLHNLFRFLRLRIHNHAQWEIRVYGEAILDQIRPLVPAAIAAWEEHQLYGARFGRTEIGVLREALLQWTAAGNTVDLRPGRLNEFYEKLGINAEELM